MRPSAEASASSATAARRPRRRRPDVLRVAASHSASASAFDSFAGPVALGAPGADIVRVSRIVRIVQDADRDRVSSDDACSGRPSGRFVADAAGQVPRDRLVDGRGRRVGLVLASKDGTAQRAGRARPARRARRGPRAPRGELGQGDRTRWTRSRVSASTVPTRPSSSPPRPGAPAARPRSSRVSLGRAARRSPRSGRAAALAIADPPQEREETAANRARAREKAPEPVANAREADERARASSSRARGRRAERRTGRAGRDVPRSETRGGRAEGGGEPAKKLRGSLARGKVIARRSTRGNRPGRSGASQQARHAVLFMCTVPGALITGG